MGLKTSEIFTRNITSTQYRDRCGVCNVQLTAHARSCDPITRWPLSANSSLFYMVRDVSTQFFSRHSNKKKGFSCSFAFPSLLTRLPRLPPRRYKKGEGKHTTQKRQVERRMQPPLACQHSSNCTWMDIFQGIFLSTRCCIRQKIKFTVDLLFNDENDFLLASLFLFLVTHRTSVNQLGFFFSVQTSPNNNLLCQSTHTRIQSLCVSVHKDRLKTRLHRDKLKDTLAARHRAPQSRPDLFHVLQIIDFEISSGSALASSGRFLSFFKLP